MFGQADTPTNNPQPDTSLTQQPGTEPQEAEPQGDEAPKKKRGILFYVLAVILVIIVIFLGYYIYKVYFKKEGFVNEKYNSQNCSNYDQNFKDLDCETRRNKFKEYSQHHANAINVNYSDPKITAKAAKHLQDNYNVMPSNLSDTGNIPATINSCHILTKNKMENVINDKYKGIMNCDEPTIEDMTEEQDDFRELNENELMVQEEYDYGTLNKESNNNSNQPPIQGSNINDNDSSLSMSNINDMKDKLYDMNTSEESGEVFDSDKINNTQKKRYNRLKESLEAEDYTIPDEETQNSITAFNDASPNNLIISYSNES